MLLDVPHEEIGTVKLGGVAPKFSESPGVIRWAGRAIGHDTRTVLARELGFSEGELDTLDADGAIATRPPDSAAAE